MIVAVSFLAHVFVRVAPVLGGVAVLSWRIQETRSPLSTRKILLPPLGMSTGFLMFTAPWLRIPWTWAGAAFVIGFSLLSMPLLWSSEMYRSGDRIFLRRSNRFLLILVGLLGLRVALHEYVEHVLSAGQTAGLFFVLAFGMILRWRGAMYSRYRALLEP